MPDAEEVSQGGPANFARLFSAQIASETPHKWIGLIFSASKLKTIKLKKSFFFPQREYFKLYFPKKLFKEITLAENFRDPEKILQAPIKKIISLILREKPDVVFLNGFGVFNWILLCAAKKTDTPVVIQHAGIWTKELRLHKHNYSLVGRKIMEQMEKESTFFSSAEVFLNTWSRDYYRKNVANGENSEVIPLPFDFNSFKKNINSRHKSVFTGANGKVRIGTIARWDDIKNHKALLALSRMAKRKKLPWHFYAVTKIPDAPSFEKKRRAYEKNITVIPSLNRTGVSDFCKSMDLLILPSIFDVSPTVVLEAIATNTPVVISQNVGYVHEFVKHGAKNWVINFKNTSKSLTGIKKIIKKPMPETLQRWIVLNHDSKKVFSSYLDLFNSVILDKQRRSISSQSQIALPETSAVEA